ncbi:sugar porter family MFS transporter [Bacillus sp. ISL-4]|uniref:sugar porter family MFS transporter n=1 Tax=Bacillus sp. ISL-4 TaxID=2819125 RepID=UPI001BE50C79|nr:sugar porter family MFS transporter [Bacillus sp. ISL-4]MBT2668976.1 sugar porter family MFS transporter [Bacillus sp. ISL-4]MBT2674460.1 sugar porter family MFS transporter [Streptomyces sp. ISL-14]
MNKQKIYRWVIYCFGALGGLLFGYDTGVISGALLFIKKDMGLSPFLEGLVVSGVLIGALIGAAFSGPVADKFGRKKTIIMLGVLFTIGAIGTAISPNVHTLIAFRIELGIAVGGASGIVPLYLAEMAPASIRGKVSSLNTIMNALGIFMAYLVNYMFAASGNWHWMLGLAVIPSVLLMSGMFFMPESPRWLWQNAKESEARRVLSLTRNSHQVEEEIRSIMQVKAEKKGNLRLLLAPGLRPILFIGIGIAVFQQVIGTNTIIYYTPTILRTAGFGSTAAIAGTIGIGVFNILFTILGMLLIDKIGRKKLLLVGNIGMTIALGTLGVGMTWVEVPVWLLLTCLSLFIVAYSASWGMVVWVILGEIFPMNVRGVAMGVASTALWLSNIVISMSFPVLVEAVGVGILFLAYAIIGVFAFLFVMKYVPETKGKTLEEIELEMAFKSKQAVS